MNKLLLVFKGACMGIADVIPGVSGGTMALILGIYAELVNTIKGLHLRWIVSGWRWLSGGRHDAERKVFYDDIRSLNLSFLLNLAVGIIAAIAIGSFFIPTLMENYPEAMRAFFFGLIITSVIVPYRMLVGQSSKPGLSIVGLLLLGFVFGFWVTNPGRILDVTQSWVALESHGESLEDIARRGASAQTTQAIFLAAQNQQLRRALMQAHPEKKQWIVDTVAKAHNSDITTDKDTLKARSKPFDELYIPEGISVNIPRPPGWYIVVSGAVAICAMILPGISGSYLLLILGMYFFVLNALKGVIQALMVGILPLTQVGLVLLFCIGALIGLLSFSRLLSYLLREYSQATLAVLIGLMLGCLRGIWPFRETLNGVEINSVPAQIDHVVVASFGMALAGVVVVATLTWIGARHRIGRHPER